MEQGGSMTKTYKMIVQISYHSEVEVRAKNDEDAEAKAIGVAFEQMNDECEPRIFVTDNTVESEINKEMEKVND